MAETLTVVDIMKMTDEEVAEANNRMARQIVKRIALKVGLTVAAVAIATIIVNKIDVPAED